MDGAEYVDYPDGGRQRNGCVRLATHKGSRAPARCVEHCPTGALAFKDTPAKVQV